MLGRDCKSKGERLNDAVIVTRQRYLECLSRFRESEESFFRLERLKDKAEDDFLRALKDFDTFYQEGL